VAVAYGDRWYEVEWWREHREHQHGDCAAADERALIAALAARYA
jgi:hypothetical protein